MTESRPPTSRIIGYLVGRWMDPSEVPTTIPVNARKAVGLLGHEDMKYLIPPGIDILELGVIGNPGRFLLIPRNAYNKALWKETVTLIVTAEQAAVQRAINARFYEALLAQLPHDAEDLQAGVEDNQARSVRHPIFDVLRRAAVETWPKERRPSEPLDDAERGRLDVAVACRAVAWLREQAPRCRLDRQSLRPIMETHIGSQWDRILASVAESDYEDATLRLLARARIGRGLQMPMSCLLQVLPGVARLDIFFAILRRASEDPVPALRVWVERDPLGAGPETAELAVRVLYAMLRMTDSPVEAKSMMRTHVVRIQHEPISADARLIKLYLATAAKVDGSYDVPEEDLHLFDGMEGAIERWEKALTTTIDEIIDSLPERAAGSPGID